MNRRWSRRWIRLAAFAGLVIPIGESGAAFADEVLPFEPTVGRHARPRAEIVDAPDPVFPIAGAGAPSSRTHDPSISRSRSADGTTAAPAITGNTGEIMGIRSLDGGWGAWLYGQALGGRAPIAIVVEDRTLVVYFTINGTP